MTEMSEQYQHAQTTVTKAELGSPAIMSRGVQARIRNLTSSLPPAGREVAALIIDKPLESSRMSVNDLAQAASVSTTTVMRLCKSLGFSGYSDFRFELALELNEAGAGEPEGVQPNDDAMAIAQKVLAADQRALRETAQLLNPEVLAEALEALAKGAHVGIYGFGSSAAVALDAYYRFSCLGLKVFLTADTFMQTVNATLLGVGDVALVISHTGRTREALACARQARSSGARVIGLTSFLNAPLLELVDITLVTATGESVFRSGTMASRIAQISVIDALYVALANRHPEAVQGRIDGLNALLEEKRVKL